MKFPVFCPTFWISLSASELILFSNNVGYLCDRLKSVGVLVCLDEAPVNADNHDSFFLSQRQHLAVCVDASAKGGQPAPLVHRVHADADTGGPMRNVTAARQHLQSTITELIGKKNNQEQELSGNIWAIISQTVFLQSLFTIKILSQFYSICVLLPVCWKGSRWWGCRRDSSWQSTLAWWQLEEECAALDL